MKITYQVLKLKNKNNYRRILGDVRKIPGVENVSLNKERHIIHIEYNNIDDLKERVLNCFNYYEKQVDLEEVIQTEVYRKVLKLKGLDCGHCASRIESLAQKTFDHEKIVVDFSTERFILETKDQNLFNNAIKEVSQIARRIDPNIEVMDLQSSQRAQSIETKAFDKKQLIFFIIGLVITFGFIIYKSIMLKNVLWLFEDIKLELLDQIILTIAFLIVGFKVIIDFFKNIIRRHEMDEKFLMTVATVGAIATGHNIEAIAVMAFYQIGEYLQEIAVNHSRKSISELLSFEVAAARLKVDDEEMEIEVESVLPGDILIVKTGEMIPVDGVIRNGKTYLDLKALTGEADYQNAKPGDKVRSGAINMGGVIEVEAKKLYKESTMSQILDMVENASATKAKSENFITKFAKIYTPVIVGIAIVVIILWPIIARLSGSTSSFYELFFGSGDMQGSIYHGMVFLVISCPCALVISIPLAFFGGIGLSSKRGILVKGSNYLEALNNVENVIFDKTGTLTKGEFSVKEKVSLYPEQYTGEEIHKILAYVEYHSTHPIGVSITDSYGRDEIFTEIIEDFVQMPGRGVRAEINGNRYIACNFKQLSENKITFEQVVSDDLVIYLVKEKQVIGYAVIGDSIREEVPATLVKLRKLGTKKIVMLTGDNAQTSSKVGKILKLEEVHSELLPNEKVEHLQKIKNESTNKNATTIYVGDGINDAPVISAADVGIAMGATGSEGSIAIADVVIMGDNIEKVSDVVTIAHATRRIVKQNIILALGIKLIVFVLNFINIPSMIWFAIFSDVGVSLLAIINSLRITGIFKKEYKETNKEEPKNE